MLIFQNFRQIEWKLMRNRVLNCPIFHRNNLCRHVIVHELALGEETLLWDEFTPHLYDIEAVLTTGQGVDRTTTEFGMRMISQVGTQLAINGRPTFLRGTLENFHHPLTGYPPTDVDYWLEQLKDKNILPQLTGHIAIRTFSQYVTLLAQTGFEVEQHVNLAHYRQPLRLLDSILLGIPLSRPRATR